MSKKAVVRPSSLRIGSVRGEPYHIGGRTLTPVARVVAFGKAKATIGTHRSGGWGFGFVQITPLSIVEETAKGERCISLRSRSSKAVSGMLGAAAAVTLVCAAVRALVRRS